MDNELIITIGEKELRFKLKSQAIVGLEKIYGKSIFEIFQELSFTLIQEILYEALQDKSLVKDKNELTDLMLSKYTLIELGDTVLQDLAVISGIIKAKDLEDASVADIKNA